LLVLLAATGWREYRKRNPPPPSPAQKAHVLLVPEAALFDNMSIRVVVSAQLRPAAPVTSIKFVHVGGYFVDQTGTRYSPGFTRVNNRSLPTLDKIRPWETHLLRTGETYRYCFGPADIDVDQSSEEAAANAIKKVTVYLDGLSPIGVPVRRWRGLDPTSDDPNDYR
jgi:hypothetical protein